MATKSISQLDSAVSLALGDLFEIAEPDVQSQTGYASKKISMSQAATYVQENVSNANLNTTDKTLVGAINEVDSEGVKWSENNVLGAKNLLKYPYYYESQIINGITWTVNSDGSITATGTATANSQFYLHTRSEGELNDFVLPNGTYIISDGLATHSSNIEIQMGITKNGAYYEVALTRNGDVQFTAEGDDYSQNSINPLIQCLVRSGQQNVNVTFKPMIRLATIADNTFEPFAQTNRQLTTEKIGYDSNNILGAKNFIDGSYAFNRTAQTVVSSYNKSDGTATINGTATGQSGIFENTPLIKIPNLKVGDGLILSLEVISGTFNHTNNATTSFFLGDASNGSALDGKYASLGNSLSAGDKISCVYNVKSEMLVDGVFTCRTCMIYMRQGDVFNNLKLAIMLRPISFYDDTYEMFALTNRQITLQKVEKTDIAPIENGDTTSQAYSVGDYMFWNNGFYKVTAAISSGGAITEGTNVTQTTIGAELKAALS